MLTACGNHIAEWLTSKHREKERLVVPTRSGEMAVKITRIAAARTQGVFSIFASEYFEKVLASQARMPV